MRTDDPQLVKGIDIGEDFEWRHLAHPLDTSNQWHRFTLFDHKGSTDWKRPSNYSFEVTGVLFDIDHTGRGIVKKLVDFFKPLDTKFYVVFTGGGYHVYMPLPETILGLEWLGYVPGYKLKCMELESKLGLAVDVPIGSAIIKYGRVPGSLNNKHGNEVKLVYTCEKPASISLKSYFGYIPQDRKLEVSSTFKPIEDVSQDTKPWFDQCAYLADLRSRPDRVTHAEFLTVIKMLIKGGAPHVAREVFGKTKHADEVESMLETRPVSLTCEEATEVWNKAKIHYKLEGIGQKLPCTTCKYYGDGDGSISSITGELPTPTANTGYFKVVVKGKTVAREFRPIEYVYGFINIVMRYRKDILVRTDYGIKSFFFFDGRTYRKVSPLDSSVLGKIGQGGEGSLRKSLYNFVPGYGEKMELWNPISKAFNYQAEDLPSLGDTYLNKHPYKVAFANGVYDPKKDVLESYTKETGLVGDVLDVEYNTDTDIRIAEKVFERMFTRRGLHNTLQEMDNLELFYVFMGLAFTTIECHQAMAALWIVSGPGKGKTAVVRAIMEVLGANACNIFKMHDMKLEDEELRIILAEKKLLLGDDLLCMNRKQMSLFTTLLTTILSGAPVRSREKHGHASVTKPYCTIFVTSNDLPHHRGSSDGLERRIRVVQIFATLGRAEQEFFEKIGRGDKEARESLALVAMKGLRLACKYHASSTEGLKNYFPPLTHFEESNNEETLLDNRERSRNVEDGVSVVVDAIEVVAGGKMKRGELYTKALSFYPPGSIRPPRKSFYRKFRELLEERQIIFDERKVDGVWYFKNIGFKDDE